MTAQQWGDLRSTLNRPEAADAARWTQLLSTLGQFSPQERPDAVSYAHEHLHDDCARWPVSVCSMSVTPANAQEWPMSWSAPLVKTLELREVHDEALADMLTLLDTHALAPTGLTMAWSSLTTSSWITLMHAPALQGLTALDLENAYGKLLRALPQLPQLSQLARLDISEVEDEQAEPMARSLARCSVLEHLGIHGGMYEKASWKRVVTALQTRLSSLDVSGSFFTSGAIGVCIEASALDDVVVLNAAQANMNTAGLKMLSRVDNQVLRHLDLTYNDLGASGVEALVGASFVESLRALILDGNSLRPAGRSIEALESSGMLERLEHLDLSGTDLGPGTCKKLFARPMPQLSRLRLHRTRLDARALEALMQCELPALAQLDLSHCQLEDEALETLTQATWPGLRHLAIDQDDRQLSPELIEALQDALGEGVEIRSTPPS